MALNPISDLLQGIKRLYVGLQGVKSDGVTMETIKTNDAGAMKVDGTMQLTGSIVVIGGVTFAVSGGDTLRNTVANKPDAATTHAVIPFCYYFSVDTGVVEVTDGVNWVVI